MAAVAGFLESGASAPKSLKGRFTPELEEGAAPESLGLILLAIWKIQEIRKRT